MILSTSSSSSNRSSHSLFSLPLYLAFSSLLLLVLLPEHSEAASLASRNHAVAAPSSPLAPLQRRLSSENDSALQWDGNAYYVSGRPTYLFSAEFHPWRLPVPSLWRDPLQKLKAAGINTLSIYTHWGLVMPSQNASSVSLAAPANDLAAFLTVAKEVGLFIILRPGPYINAETTGGGMPGWVQNLDTQLRVQNDTWNAAWQPYMKAIIDAALPFQVKAASNSSDGTIDTSGGTLLAVQVENEFQQTGPMEAYFDDIIQFYKDNGVTVPTTFNALSGGTEYSNNTVVNIWGQDSYPQNFDCANPQVWTPVQDYSDLSTVRKSNPASIPEFQGGSYDAYNGSTYEACAELTNENFVRVFDKGILGNGVKFLSQYMGYGGTNWGNLAFGGLVYTSYDYGAGVNEKRIKRNKLYELGLLGSFLQSFPAFANSSLLEQGTNQGVTNQSSDIYVSHLISSSNQISSSWYIVRQNDSTSTDTATFKMDVTVGGQNFTIPSNGTMKLAGRDSVILPVDIPLLASGATLNYSTADVNFLGQIDGRDVLFVHGVEGQQYELAIQSTSTLNHSNSTTTLNNNSTSFQDVENGTIIAWTAMTNSSQSVILDTAGKEILIMLSDITYAFLLQPLSLAQPGTLDAIAGTGERIVVQGAYHIANQTMNGTTLALTGQLNQTTTLEVFAGANVTEVSFNGASSNGTAEKTSYGSLKATFSGPEEIATSYKPPALVGWKNANSLPEIETGYVPDSNWVSANLTNTSNTWQIYTNNTNGKVLFADAYGFHSGGNILWQGRFNLSENDTMPTQLNVSLMGGAYFASATYLNGHYVGETKVDSSKQVNAVFDLNATDFITNGTNVFTVVMDSTGLEEVGQVQNANSSSHPLPLETTKSPRGILQFELVGGAANNTSLNWIVTGKQGGETVLDTVRGSLNEGGLYGERMGWHLPGFDDSQWSEGNFTSPGLNTSGVQFYRTNVSLNVPVGHDLPLSLVFGGEAKNANETWRALIFVNGWQYGRRLAQYGPQVNFPIPPGIIDPRGNNTIALALWATSNSGAQIPSLELEVQGVFAGDVEYQLNNPTYQQVRGSSTNSTM